VSALRNIHTALRPGGLLLDIHPEPENPWLVAVMGDETMNVGQLDDSFRAKTVLAARAALHTVVDAGLFVREHEITFTFNYHFASVADWQWHMTNNWHSAGIAAGMVERAQAAMSAGAVELRIARAIHAARLRTSKLV
jgi:hypothetical protein